MTREQRECHKTTSTWSIRIKKSNFKAQVDEGKDTKFNLEVSDVIF